MTRLLVFALVSCCLLSCRPAPVPRPAPAASGGDLESVLAIYELDTGQVRTVTSARALYEAPNWTPDGRALIFNAGGRLYRIPVEGGTPVRIDTGPLDRLNNDHGISPDGKLLVVSNGDGHIYTLPFAGGTPTRVTQGSHNYWHGISPDGRTLAYVARRDEDHFDIYTLPVTGGEERRMTTHPGHEDGPDYTPDGRYIYFNADWAGNFDIWRIPAEGGTPEQITRDAYEDWFPHPSPDGEKVVLLSYEPGTEGHPRNRPVRLRLMKPDGSDLVDLVELFGGQGTINVPSWSPDSRAFAFVYYRLLSQEDR